MTAKRIDVLVVDDAEVVRMFLEHLIDGDPALRVAGSVADGEAAVRFVQKHRPDVVLMDIHMDGMDGFEAARRIMETCPVPIVMCSAVGNVREVATAFRVYEAGAVALVEKPPGLDHPQHGRFASEMLRTVRLMSEVKVVRRWARKPPRPATPEPVAAPVVAGSRIHVVGIGASTGGPPALQTLLGGLARDFPVPILVVQHIAAGFLPGLAEWLGQTTALQLQIAAHGQQALPGHVYLAPDDLHLGIDPELRIVLQRTPPENGLRPSVDHLFRTLAAAHGAKAAGILLTGMGKDGARGLGEMRRHGAPTLAQDRATSIIFGMPGEAVALGAAGQVLPIDRISGVLDRLVRDRDAGQEPT